MVEIAYCNVGQHGLENLLAEISRVRSLDPTENEDPCRLLQKPHSREPWIISSVRVAKLHHTVLLAQIFFMLFKSLCVCGSLEICLFIFGGERCPQGGGQVSERPPILQYARFRIRF